MRLSGFLTEETVEFTRARLARSPWPDSASGQAAAAAAGRVGGPVLPAEPAAAARQRRRPGARDRGRGRRTRPASSGRRRAGTCRSTRGRAVRGAGRSWRHGGDGRGDPDELLGCRRGSQVAQRYTGLLDGAALLPSLSSGALPAEATALAREALLLSPHLLDWLAGIAAPPAAGGAAPDAAPGPAAAGQRAGLALRHDRGYLGKAASLGTVARGDLDGVRAATVELLRRHSLLDGVEPDLVALTSWAQPWVPMWLEWEVRVTPAGRPGRLAARRGGPRTRHRRRRARDFRPGDGDRPLPVVQRARYSAVRRGHRVVHPGGRPRPRPPGRGGRGNRAAAGRARPQLGRPGPAGSVPGRCPPGPARTAHQHVQPAR